MPEGARQSQLAAEANVRPEIAVSWWRSELLGVRPELAIEALAQEPLLDADEPGYSPMMRTAPSAKGSGMHVPQEMLHRRLPAVHRGPNLRRRRRRHRRPGPTDPPRSGDGPDDPDGAARLRRELQRVCGYLDAGVADGAKPIVGGS